MTTAVITLASAARADHVARQQRRLTAVDARIVVWLDETVPGASATDAARTSAALDLSGATLVHVPPATGGLRLAAGRNAGAAAALEAGCDRLVFLDADCVPGDALVARYDRGITERGDALLAGPVTYLPEGVVVEPATDLQLHANPHPARPAPADGTLVEASADEQVLFWSLSFALASETWMRIGGFDEGYVGYGAEDTDFALRARAAGAPLVWVGGADAYHQHHPTSSPPWQHLDDILRNGRRFAEAWDFWPMRGWLDAFAAAGAIEFVDGDWRRTH